MLSQTQTCDALGHRLSFTAETLIRKQSISLRECQPLLHLCDNFYREGGTGLQRHLSIIYNQLMMIAEEDGMNLQAQIRFAKVVCSFSYWRVAAPNINGDACIEGHHLHMQNPLPRMGGRVGEAQCGRVYKGLFIMMMKEPCVHQYF